MTRGVETNGGAKQADIIRTLATTFPLRWLERSLPPSLLGKFGEEARTGWIRCNIIEDQARGIRGPISGAAEARRRRLETMRKRFGP